MLVEEQKVCDHGKRYKRYLTKPHHPYHEEAPEHTRNKAGFLSLTKSTSENPTIGSTKYWWRISSGARQGSYSWLLQFNTVLEALAGQRDKKRDKSKPGWRRGEKCLTISNKDKIHGSVYFKKSCSNNVLYKSNAHSSIVHNNQPAETATLPP